jgi:hypothetical protein
MLIVLVIFIALPLLGEQTGVNLGFVSDAIARSTNAVIVAILWLTANA